MQHVIGSEPDGHILIVGTASPIVVAPQAMKSVKFDPLTDLTAVNMLSFTSIAIGVHPSIEARTIGELAELSRKKPITMALPLVGSVSHLVTEMVAKATGCNFLNVPYTGGGPALNDTIGGHVNSTVSDMGVLIPQHQAGKLRIVFLSADKRVDGLPDVQVASEVKPELEVKSWIGMFAHGKTPKPIIEKINAAVVSSLASDAVRAQYKILSATPNAMASPDAFQKFVVGEHARFGAILRERGIVING